MQRRSIDFSQRNFGRKVFLFTLTMSVVHIRLTHLRMQKHLEHKQMEKEGRGFINQLYCLRKKGVTGRKMAKFFITIAYGKGVINVSHMKVMSRGKCFLSLYGHILTICLERVPTLKVNYFYRMVIHNKILH